jgi:hypothetical protein
MSGPEGDEAADRLAIRELVDAYAFCADARDVEGQSALFTDDTRFVVYMAGEGSDATDDLRGRESLRPVFENLSTYEVTMHFNGPASNTPSVSASNSADSSSVRVPQTSSWYRLKGVSPAPAHAQRGLPS